MSEKQDADLANDLIDVLHIVADRLPEKSWVRHFLGKVTRAELFAILIIVEQVFSPLRKLVESLTGWGE